MHPLISVVIPVHNKERYVARAIRSVLDQTYQNFDLIVVDDASDDCSMQRVEAFRDPRIRQFHRTTPGPGGYAARNLGISVATGTWVAFLDADDAWLPEHLANAMHMATEFSDVPLISAARLSCSLGKETLDPFAKYFIEAGPQILYFSDYLHYACKGKRAIGTNSLLVRRECLPHTAIFPEGRTERSGDLYTWVVLIAMVKRMVWSPHVASVSYRDASTVSRSSVPSMTLFRDMVSDLAPYLSRSEVRELKVYANKMIKYAWLERKKKRLTTPFKELYTYFYWKADFFFCLKWTLISLLPFEFLNSLHKQIASSSAKLKLGK